MPNQTAANWITLNQTTGSQTKTSTTKSCEICSLLQYYEAYSGNCVLMCLDNLSVTASRVKKSRRVIRA